MLNRICKRCEKDEPARREGLDKAGNITVLRCGNCGDEWQEEDADGVEVPRKAVPVRGAETDRVCERCGRSGVLLVYRRLGRLILYCTPCKHVWGVEVADKM